MPIMSDFIKKERWMVVTVLGRPSLNTRDFFNSIKFEVYDSKRTTQEGALDNDPALQPDYEKWTADGYQILNWYSFPEEI